MSKIPLKKHEWHISADKQEKRRLFNKKKRKKLKALNKQAKLLLSINEKVKP